MKGVEEGDRGKESARGRRGEVTQTLPSRREALAEVRVKREERSIF